MKVCLIMPSTFPVPATKGGACETLVNNLIDENEKKGKLEIVCVSIFEEEAYKKSKDYKKTRFIYIKNGICKGKKDLFFRLQDQDFVTYMDNIYEKIKDETFDYIVIEGGNLMEYKYLLNKFPKEKCIAHIHGNYIGDDVMNSTYQYFITVSDFIADKFKQSGIIDSSRVKRLYNGIKVENFDKETSKKEKIALKNKYKIADDEQIVLFCGRTVKKKGIKELITAFKNTKNIDKTKLLIVGSSNFADNVENEYEQELAEVSKEIMDKVVFCGFIPNDELYKMYDIADIAVFPTIGEEAFGLVVIEAMAGGCPVITTKSGGFPEIAKGTSTILVNKDERLIGELTNSIDYLLESREQRKKMSIEGKKRARDFSNEKFYENFVNILLKIKENSQENGEIR